MSHWDKATHFRSKSPPKRSVTNLDWKSQKYLVLEKCKSLENWSQFLIFSSKFDVKQYKLFSLFEMSRDIRFWYFRVTNWQTREQTIEMDHGSCTQSTMGNKILISKVKCEISSALPIIQWFVQVGISPFTCS